MFRRVLAGVAAALVAAAASADLAACGDKFLRVGRSQRNRNYAAVHPVSILVYTPAATAKGLKEFETILQKAGHSTVGVRDRALLPKALAAARYDLIITSYADATRPHSGSNWTEALGYLRCFRCSASRPGWRNSRRLSSIAASSNSEAPSSMRWRKSIT